MILTPEPAEQNSEAEVWFLRGLFLTSAVSRWYPKVKADCNSTSQAVSSVFILKVHIFE